MIEINEQTTTKVKYPTICRGGGVVGTANKERGY